MRNSKLWMWSAERNIYRLNDQLFTWLKRQLVVFFTFVAYWLRPCAVHVNWSWHNDVIWRRRFFNVVSGSGLTPVWQQAISRNIAEGTFLSGRNFNEIWIKMLTFFPEKDVSNSVCRNGFHFSSLIFAIFKSHFTGIEKIVWKLRMTMLFRAGDVNIDGLMQDCSNSIAYVLELLQSNALELLQSFIDMLSTNWVILGSSNGLSRVRCPAVICTNGGLLPIVLTPLWWKQCEIKYMIYLKVLSSNNRSF